MALANYTDLVAAVQDFLNRQDLASAVPTFISVAEAQINRRLRVRRMTTINAAFSISGEYVNLPTDFAGPISLQLSTREVLDNVSAEALQEIKRCNGGSTGKPTAYAVVGGQFQFDTAPATAYTATLVYYGRVPALTQAAPTNWLMTDHPDAYLYGALLQSAPYLVDDARLSVWTTLFTTILADIELADRHESFGAKLTPIAAQVA